MKYIYSLFLLVLTQVVIAQEVLENNPPSIRWYKINTPHFKVLHPKGFEEQAQRVANTLEHIREPEAKSLGVTPRKISIVLQNQSAISNGFVSMVPRRSEFYAMPSQNYNFTGTNDWLDMLAAHEYRHIVQFERANTGFSKLMYYVFGSATFSAFTQTSVPQWFWEGDAVVTETAFTRSGRGRIPNFGLVFKTNLLEGREFNYHKQYLRSYKHNIPNHYVLGYYMTGYLRNKLNDVNVWERITRRTWNVPFIPFAFSNSIKKESGRYVVQLYRDMAADLKKEWREEISQLQLTSFEQIYRRKRKAYTDYRFPQVLDDGGVLVMKEGIGDIEQFVILKNDTETRVFTPGIVNETAMLSAVGSTIVWNEFGYDPRWPVKNYSVIKLYNIESKKLKVLSRHTRYAGAALSPDQSKVVTIETETDYKNSIVVMDTTGQRIKRFDNPENVFYSMPRWSADGQQIVVLKTTGKGRAVSLFELATGAERELLPFSDENIGYPVLVGNHLLYNSPVSGIDNIYVYDIDTQKKYQVTSSKYGAYNPCLSTDGGILYYNEQTRDGLDVVKTSLDPTQWKPVAEFSESGRFYQKLVEQEGNPDLFKNVPDNPYPTKRYRTTFGIFNPYSWGAVFNTSLTEVEIGIASQDILSTTTLKTGYVYDLYERTGAWKAGISYQKWFPIIDLNFVGATRRINEGEIIFDKVVGTDTTKNVIENLTFDWEERSLEAGIRIPLITTNSRFRGNFTVSNYIGYTSVTNFKNSIDGGGRLLPTNYPQYFFRDYIDQGSLLYNYFGITTYRLLKQSRRDINSKWGQVLYLDWFTIPKGTDYAGNQFSAYSVLYFPGFFKHHSIWGYWAYQGSRIDAVRVNSGEGLDNYTFRNQIPLPRGHSISRFQKFYSMSANYTLPLWYPDIAIGPIINLQRVRGNAFIDYGFGSSVFPNSSFSRSYVSVGGELKVDFNVMRTLPQFNMGIRYSYGLQPSVTKFEILIGTFNF